MASPTNNQQGTVVVVYQSTYVTSQGYWTGTVTTTTTIVTQSNQSPGTVAVLTPGAQGYQTSAYTGSTYTGTTTSYSTITGSPGPATSTVIVSNTFYFAHFLNISSVLMWKCRHITLLQALYLLQSTFPQELLVQPLPSLLQEHEVAQFQLV